MSSMRFLRRILPRSQVQEIIDRFAQLNRYGFGSSILRFLDGNYIDSDPKKGFRNELLAFCISAKRYTTYEPDGKAHRFVIASAWGLPDFRGVQSGSGVPLE